jgi:hypothetical protein
MRIEGDRLYGPGAEDMKGGTHIALAALRQIAREGIATHLPIRHLMVSDEEMGSPTSREHIEREARRARYVIVTEPARSGGKIVTARKGCGSFRVEVTGRPAHAGVEHHLGRNAIRELARQIEAIEAMTDYERGLTVNVGLVGGGTRQNVVPEHAWAEVDVRVPNPALGEEITRRMLALQSVDPDCRLVVTGCIDRPGYEKTPAIAALFEHARALAAELGFDLVDLKTGGGSDGNFTANIARPGSKSMMIHSDQSLVAPEPWLTPWSINIIWCLCDLHADNGATLYAPGTHRITSRAELPDDLAELGAQMVPFDAPAGSVVAMDGRVWHTSGANVTTDEDRPLLFGYYTRPFVRPQWNHSVGLSAETQAACSPTLRYRLGLDVWQNVTYGRA